MRPNIPDLHLMSQNDVADILGVHKSRISVIELRALKKLKAGFLADPIIREYIIEHQLGVVNARDTETHSEG